jgi:hypothetical protein
VIDYSASLAGAIFTRLVRQGIVLTHGVLLHISSVLCIAWIDNNNRLERIGMRSFVQ